MLCVLCAVCAVCAVCTVCTVCAVCAVYCVVCVLCVLCIVYCVCTVCTVVSIHTGHVCAVMYICCTWCVMPADLVWSDPEEVDGWAISPRGAGYLFGDRVTSEVCLLFTTASCFFSKCSSSLSLVYAPEQPFLDLPSTPTRSRGNQVHVQ